MKSKPHKTKKARWRIIVLIAAARRWQAGKPAVKPRDIVRTYLSRRHACLTTGYHATVCSG